MGLLSTGRGLISTLLHVVSTGLIAYVLLYSQTLKQEKKVRIPLFWSIVLALLAGVSLHVLYNLSLHFAWTWLLALLLFLAYFLLTYLLFRSDRMWERK
ncbi:MAG: PrsW family intramembrane metalloprotease [bacterium]|nr:PrsW family intramembrane metalloprotease [bacterium]